MSLYSHFYHTFRLTCSSLKNKHLALNRVIFWAIQTFLSLLKYFFSLIREQKHLLKEHAPRFPLTINELSESLGVCTEGNIKM